VNSIKDYYVQKNNVKLSIDNYISQKDAIVIRKIDKIRAPIKSFFRNFEIFVFLFFTHSRCKQSEEVKYNERYNKMVQ
jgi:hypothetical protein